MALDARHRHTCGSKASLDFFQGFDVTAARDLAQRPGYADDGVTDADLAGEPGLALLPRREQFSQLDATVIRSAGLPAPRCGLNS